MFFSVFVYFALCTNFHHNFPHILTLGLLCTRETVKNVKKIHKSSTGGASTEAEKLIVTYEEKMVIFTMNSV